MRFRDEAIYMPGGGCTPASLGQTLPCTWDPSGPCPTCLFIWSFFCILYYIFCNKSINKGESLSSVNHSSKLSNPKWGSYGPQFIGGKKFRWQWKWGWSCGAEHLTYGIWCQLQVDSVQTELNWTWQNCVMCGKPTHLFRVKEKHRGGAFPTHLPNTMCWVVSDSLLP